jgi:eukaryotic-like serine/threonine-protein kinase
VRAKLLPPLEGVYRNDKRRETERSQATDILAEYAADQPQVLANLLMDADEKQFADAAKLYLKLTVHGKAGAVLLQNEVEKPLASAINQDDKEKLAKRQANAAVLLLRMGQADKVWPLLKHSPDPRVRSYLIHRFSPLGADAGAIVKRLLENAEPDVTIRRALILSLGEYGEKELSSDAGKALLAKLQGIYCTDADPGLHAASEWLLGTWNQKTWLKEVNEKWAKGKDQRKKRLQEIKHALAKDQAPPQWYVNSQEQTMVVIPESPEPFLMGSPPTEAGRLDHETQHKKRIGRTFAIAAKSVTVEQILRMGKNYFGKSEAFVRRYAPKDDCPAVTIHWHMAAEYCNWLSEQEDLPPCYEIKSGKVTKLKDNFHNLTGYRLPTEAEMEYATRAGAETSRYFGETEDLLPKYAWYLKNAQENVFTWCQDSYKEYPTDIIAEAIEDKNHDLVFNSTYNRMLRGGSFSNHAPDVRSANRVNLAPSTRVYDDGFRVARTFTP